MRLPSGYVVEPVKLRRITAQTDGPTVAVAEVELRLRIAWWRKLLIRLGALLGVDGSGFDG